MRDPYDSFEKTNYFTDLHKPALIRDAALVRAILDRLIPTLRLSDTHEARSARMALPRRPLLANTRT